ncbi:integrase core domain-containing protein, partial [Mycobacterium sp. SMC-17]|uniref:integrase core domain-containing protein n=1 Tax=Mycobacterium sp. SMC-17 TaxID=3381628 RepID=UPI0038770F44
GRQPGHPDRNGGRLKNTNPQVLTITLCWDNAATESFWATLKVEFYDRYLWPTKAAAKLAVGDWIERIYNRRRRHSAIGMITPVEYENRITKTAQAA